MNNNKRIKTDYKTPLFRSRRRRPNLHWRLRWAALGLGSVVLGVVMAKTQEPGAAPADLGGRPDRELSQVELELPAVESTGRSAPVGTDDGDVAYTRTLVVEPGDTFARLLSGAGVAERVVHDVVTSGEPGRALGRIYPGDAIRLSYDDDDRLLRLAYETEPGRRIVFDRADDGFAGRVVEDPLQRRLEHTRGRIETSLFQAGADAGLDDRMIMELVRIFGWDIDFALDIRRGDRFTVIYERYYQDGEPVHTGDIVAAQFVNQGQVYRAVRYTDPSGETAYFAPDGASMRKAFLRTPVKFTRISSGFGRRYHPVLHRMREHHGVDYAAPRGTPVRATGDGRVRFRGYKGGYGRMVVIRHGGRYSTAYAHMSRYARGTAPGRRVEQGEVIGYVGSSGRSTGPHLHYEFRVNGVHKNPLTVEFPSVEPVAEAHRDHFRARARPLLAQLDTLDSVHTRLASAQP